LRREGGLAGCGAMRRPEEPGAPAALSVSAVNLPLLGSRTSPHSAFQYLLDAVDTAGATFACPSWLVRREHFRPGDIVDFHFPFRTADGWHRQQGEVVEAARDEEGTGQVCRARFRDRQPLHHPVHASVETGTIEFRSENGEPVDDRELLVEVLHDCMMQKRGVRVYYKHLVPLFSRITEFPTEDFGALRSMVLEDVRKRIEANVAAFEAWHAQAESGALDIGRDLDLEKLRAAAEGEIENDLFEATFNSPSIGIYISAIRLLEQKLYMNYNTLVLLYAKSL